MHNKMNKENILKIEKMENIESNSGSATNGQSSDRLPYISSSPGEFPIIGSTICLDPNNPTWEEFVTARECGLSAGISGVRYYSDGSTYLTSKFRPNVLNSGIGLIVSTNTIKKDKYILDVLDDGDDKTALEKIQDGILTTVQQPFVTGIDIADEPAWGNLVYTGSTPIIHPTTSATSPASIIISDNRGPLTKTYTLIDNIMKSQCDVNGIPYRQLYINFAGNNNSSWTGGHLAPIYYNYLKEVDNLLHPMCWSFDLYPGVINPETGFRYAEKLEDLYNILDSYLQISIDTNRPFRMICLATEFENGEGFYNPTPKINHLRLEVFTALAYGAQEIQYWTYCQRAHSDDVPDKYSSPPAPDSEDQSDYQKTLNGIEFYISSPVNRLGEKNQIWYSIQEINEEIRQFSRVFQGCRVLHIEHTNDFYESDLVKYLPDDKKPGFYTHCDDLPLNVEIISEQTAVTANDTNEDVTYEIAPIFKGVMVSYLCKDPDNMSTDSSAQSSVESAHAEHYAVIVTHDPDNYKTVKITFKSGYEITEMTPRVLRTNSDAQNLSSITRDLMPGGYLIFKYRKIAN